MNCKFCQHELEEGVTLCPNCGKENAEPVEDTRVEAPETTENVRQEVQAEAEETSKPGIGKIGLALGILVALIVLLAAMVMGSGETGGDSENETTGSVEATVPADTGLNDATCKGTYTVADDVLASGLDVVVATLGDEEMTVADLQVYYWLQVREFLSSTDFYYLYYYYGVIDYTQPLDTQICYYDETLTWQQYFVQCAVEAWQEFTAMAVAAEENNIEMLEDLRSDLENMEEMLEETAVTNGFASTQELLEYNMGPGATIEAYAKYLEVYYLGYSYYMEMYEAFNPSAEEVEAYFTENAAYYEAYGVTTDAKTVAVRHVLITPEGGTTDATTGTTTYTDEEWAAAEAEAQRLLEEWLAGEATEDTFAELANTYSTDPGSNTTGGLYTGVAEGDMVTEFNDWCFDEVRVVGDYGLVKTTYGWHIMYFSGETYVWYATAEEDLLYERINTLMDEAIAKYALEVDYSALILGNVDLTA